MSIPLIVIAGPTAVGKSDLAFKVALEIGGEIVSADSVQVYKYLDIGSAKPSAHEMEMIPHHMIDIAKPNMQYSAAMYASKAKEAIRGIAERGKVPVMVGGTGLYINSVIYPMHFTDASVDQTYRLELSEIAREKGNVYIHEMLKQIDAASAEKISVNDTKRIIRALEVYHLTGKRMSSFVTDFRRNTVSDYNILMLGVKMDRQALYNRINLRTDNMIAQGLVQETESLLKKYPGESVLNRFIGYKQIMGYLSGETTLEEAVNLIKRETRRYAKRQLTWFNKDGNINWLDVKSGSIEDLDMDIILGVAQKIIT